MLLQRVGFRHVVRGSLHPKTNIGRPKSFAKNFKALPTSALGSDALAGDARPRFQEEARGGPEGHDGAGPGASGASSTRGARPSLQVSRPVRRCLAGASRLHGIVSAGRVTKPVAQIRRRLRAVEPRTAGQRQPNLLWSVAVTGKGQDYLCSPRPGCHRTFDAPHGRRRRRASRQRRKTIAASSRSE